jgi:membrane-bound lytic murein transglycosylase D
LKNNDWFLALASYNWGERSVRRAIERNKRAKRKTDYLSLRMPRETRNYIPKLLAMREIIINPEKYNVVLPFIPNEPYFSSIEMEQSIDLAKVSDLSEVDVSELKSLNANLLRPIFNKKHASNILLPSYNSIIFKKNYKNFLKRREPSVEWGAVRLKKTSSISEIAKTFGVDEGELSEANGIRSSKIKLRKGSTFIIKVKNNALDNTQRIESFKRANLKFLYPDKIFHKVKRGDTLSTIARKYRTTVKTLKRLNNIRGSLIRSGQQIRVRSSSPENQKIKPNVHKVRRGESLYKIAKRYKTTVAELKRINKLGNDLIIAGTRLIVR